MRKSQQKLSKRTACKNKARRHKSRPNLGVVAGTETVHAENGLGHMGTVVPHIPRQPRHHTHIVEEAADKGWIAGTVRRMFQSLGF